MIPRSEPPLCPPAIWPWTAAVTAVLMALAVYGNATHGKIANHQRRLAERMAVLATEGPAKGPLVVAVGNSLLRQGLEWDHDLEAALRARHGDRPVRHWNMARAGLQFSDLEPYWAPMTRLRPDLVIVQREFLVASPEPTHDGRALRQFRRFLIEKLLPAGSFLAPEQHGVWNGADVDRRVDDLITHSPFKQAVPGPVIARLSALLDAGTRVVVVAIPRAARIEPLGAEIREAWARKLAHHEALRGRLTFLSYGGTLGDDQFEDGAHLNRQGRLKFTAWYAGAVARLVARKPASPSIVGQRGR